MERPNDAMELLDLILQPAFCVKDGRIQKVNAAAASRMLSVGDTLGPLLRTGQEEYAAFTGGCLYLVLEISGAPCGASVTRHGDTDVFLLEQDEEQENLRAMALAAQELREPLSVIMTVTDALFPILTSQEKGMDAQTARINRGLFQMLRVVSNMSDAARFSGETAGHMETRDISQIFDELFERAGGLMAHTGLTLHYTGLRQRVFCLVDGERLERAVYNLLSNAMKFTPKGGAVEAKVQRKGEKLYLSVQDNGCGVPETIQSTIYSRYLRQPGVEDGRYGIGLGMLLVRSAAACHGGTVLMEQVPGGGVRFTMTVAIRQNARPALRSPMLQVDYAGERDHALTELSDSLPSLLYNNIN